jgi:DNA helicase-2/ATP-dependent DNA helicase PcrA
MSEEDSLQNGDEGRVWGPPGCGKTTYVSKQIARAADKYGASSVLVTSFTRAAAIELTARDLPIPGANIGTLHSHCYRAFGRPRIAEKQYLEWNRQHPGYTLSPTDATVDQSAAEFQQTSVGNELYGQMQILRARMVPPEQWPGRVRRFAEVWTEWKRRLRLSDFTDLIEDALRDLKTAPGRPNVIVADEAQDLSRLQLALLRQWGRNAEYLLMAMDDDQTIYVFTGGSPEALLERSPFFQTVLKQSHRIPRAIQKLSNAWIQQVAVRQPKEYLPRDADGQVEQVKGGHYKFPEAILDHAERHLAAGKTVMFLATCSYLLEPLRAVLRLRGIPFHNPYRLKRRDWNPMESVDPILAYLQPRKEAGGRLWDAGELRRWTPWLRSDGMLVVGADQVIAAMNPKTRITVDILDQLFRPEVLADIIHHLSDAPLAECVSWWLARLHPKRQRAGRYLSAVALRGGIDALKSPPQVILGTGHSVKGGEADVVYFLPDLSASGLRQWEGPRQQRDAIIRLAYVMMTRARETLAICEPAGPSQMPIAAFAAKVCGKT